MKKIRFLKEIGAAFFALMMFAVPASAISLLPNGTAQFNTGSEVYFADVDPAPGGFNDEYTFENNTGDDLLVRFRVNTTFTDGVGIGVANLTFSFDNMDLFTDLTDANGVLLPSPYSFSVLILDGVDLVLHVTGATLNADGGSYDFFVAAVPIPPALLLFGTSLLGLGFLSSRRRRRKVGSKVAVV